jgi:B9 domain-containing protein 1
MAAPSDGFHVMATGQIESGRFEGSSSLYCRYGFAFGDDWRVLRGVEEGITQMSSASGASAGLAVWNFPIDVTFRATCVHGWPQIVVSVYGEDYLGRSDMILGYGATHLPLTPGRHEIVVRTFRPLASSLFGRFQSWCATSPRDLMRTGSVAPVLPERTQPEASVRAQDACLPTTARPSTARPGLRLNGMRPEFIESLFPAKGEGRDVTRVQSFGAVKLELDVSVQGMEQLGYSVPTGHPPGVRINDPFARA